MTETIIIKSKQQLNVNKLAISIIIVGIVIGIIMMSVALSTHINAYNEHEHRSTTCDYITNPSTYERVYTCDFVLYQSGIGYAFGEKAINVGLIPFLIIVGFGAVAFILYNLLEGYELIVSDKRIYGTISWGKRVDLPLDSISAISIVETFKGVSVSTSSGRISFLLLANAEEIYNEISKLLMNRQNERHNIERNNLETDGNAGNQSAPADSVEKLKQLKELLDAGIISQEEFDEKKKQILDSAF